MPILNVALEVIVILCDVANYIIATIMKSLGIKQEKYNERRARAGKRPISDSITEFED